MDFLKRQQVNYKYTCYKKHIMDLKVLPIGDENCECGRFTICLMESFKIIDYLFKELNIAYDSLESACDNAFCKDIDFCEKQCCDDCIKSAVSRLLHENEMKQIDKNN